MATAKGKNKKRYWLHSLLARIIADILFARIIIWIDDTLVWLDLICARFQEDERNLRFLEKDKNKQKTKQKTNHKKKKKKKKKISNTNKIQFCLWYYGFQT